MRSREQNDSLLEKRLGSVHCDWHGRSAATTAFPKSRSDCFCSLNCEPSSLITESRSMPSPPPIETFGVREMESDSTNRRRRIWVVVGLARMGSNPMIPPAANSFPEMHFPWHFFRFRFENPVQRSRVCSETRRARVNASNLSKS
jgi:hypothetical protein